MTALYTLLPKCLHTRTWCRYGAKGTSGWTRAASIAPALDDLMKLANPALDLLDSQIQIPVAVICNKDNALTAPSVAMTR